MFRVWSAGDDLKNETFSSADTARPGYYLGIEGLEVRDNVSKVDLGRPLRNIWENTQHLSDFDDRMFYHVKGDSSGVFNRSLVNGFSIGDTDIVTVTVNPGTGDTIRFYARLGPGIAYHNKHVVVNRPQTQIAERQISKILKLDDWKDEGVSIRYFFNTDMFQAKITKRNTNAVPISYYFVDPAFYGDSTKWGDSRVGYSSSLKLFEAIYNTAIFTSSCRTSLGDSIDLIQCEPVVNFKKSQIVFAGDTIFWVVKANGSVVGTTTFPATTDLCLWATKVNITAQAGTTVNKGDSRKFIPLYHDFGQHLFLNVPKEWADTNTLSMTRPWSDTRNHPYTFVTNRNSFIVFLRQTAGVGTSPILGWTEDNAVGVTPARSGVFYGNKDLIISRWTNAGDTLGRAWASVMSMSGDSWTFYGDKGLRNGSFFPMASSGQNLGRPSNTWRVWGDSGIFTRSLSIGDTVFVNTVKSNKLIGDTVFVNTVKALKFVGDTVFVNTVKALKFVGDTVFVNTVKALKFVGDTVFVNTVKSNKLIGDTVFVNTVKSNKLIGDTAFVNTVAVKKHLAADTIFNYGGVYSTFAGHKLIGDTAFVNTVKAKKLISDSIFTGTLKTAGSTNIGTTLNVTGHTILNTLGTTGAATVGTTLGVTGATILSSTLAVNGDELTSTSASFNLLNSPTTITIGSTTGTTTIRSKRTVVGTTDGDSFIVRGGIVRLGSGDSNGIFMLSRRISAGDTGKRITTAGGDTGILFRGSINAYKVYNAVWNDYAEAFTFDPKEKHLVAGYVYAQGPDGAVRARRRADKATLGVFSDTYAMLLGSRGCISEDKNGTKIPIALAGKVQIYVRGKLGIGDLLVTDKNGFGVKANFFERIFKSDRILGKVLENHNGNNPSRIWMLVR
jgi:hypothetical protein